MQLNEEHIRFGETVFSNRSSLRYFLATVKNSYPEFFKELETSCDEFITHLKFRRNEVRQQRIAVEGFLSYVCGKIAALYKANGDKIPHDIVPLFRTFKVGCDSREKIKERFNLFCTVNSDWAYYFIICASNDQFCEHGLGPVYAWAEAFLEAQKLDEKRALDSKDVAERTESLTPKWLEDIEINLPKGKKNIGEE